MIRPNSNKYIITLSLIAIFISRSLYAQNSPHEVGGYIGLASIQTDYGVKNEASRNAGDNIGFGIGIVHFLNFYNLNRRWNSNASFFINHFRLRSEISYTTATLKRRLEENQTPNDYNAMQGKTSIIGFGTGLEYHFKNIGKSYYRTVKFSPYLFLGISGNYSSPSLKYSLGDWEQDISILPSPWNEEEAIDMTSNFSVGINFNVGLRYAFSEKNSIIFDTKWSAYSNDWIDGLNAQVAQNNSRDWSFMLSVGYIINLN